MEQVPRSNPYVAPEAPLIGRVTEGSPRRTLLAWGFRYLLVGAVIGFLLSTFVFPITIEAVPFSTVLGAVVGAVFGCVGAAFDRWNRGEASE